MKYKTEFFQTGYREQKGAVLKEQSSMIQYLLNNGFCGQESEYAHLAVLRSSDGLASVVIEYEEGLSDYFDKLTVMISAPTNYNFRKKFPNLVSRMTPVTDLKDIPKK